MTPELYLDVKWTPRGWQWVDPMKDGQAGVLAIQNGLASRTQLLDEQGLDYEEILESLKQEQELADEFGVKVAASAAKEPEADQEEKDPEEKGPEEADDDDDDDSKDESRLHFLGGTRK